MEFWFDDFDGVKIIVRFFCPIRGRGTVQKYAWTMEQYDAEIARIPKILAKNGLIFEGIDIERILGIPF